MEEISLFDVLENVDETPAEVAEAIHKVQTATYTDLEVATNRLWLAYKGLRRTLRENRFAANKAYTDWAELENKEDLEHVAQIYRGIDSWEKLDKQLSAIESLLKKGNFWHCTCSDLRKIVNKQLVN